ncbi:MAG: asparagine synthase (glutamine-hydrolyzing) [bacterium]
MCGIAGIYNFNKQSVPDSILRKMVSVISHRGPDDEGIMVDKNIGLGHKRLSIVDLSSAGHQPMSNEDGMLWIVYNGEAYNFKEIKESLVKKGYKFKSNTDTEVILHSYREWGTSCLERFNGMFAFAIWDKRNNKLFIARDRLGIKPLYYFHKNGVFVFGSEIKTILQHPKVKTGVNKSALVEYLNLRYVMAPKTMFKDICKLKQGHFLEIENGKIKIRQYWNIFSKILLNNNKDEAFYIEAYTELLRKSIKRRLISDVPLGAYLSGGLDSSVVVGFMSQIAKEPIKTFSVGFGRGAPIDELKYARITANYFKTDHHELTVKPVSLEQIDKIIYHMEEPIVDPAIIPTYLLSEFARKHVTVVLTGEGSDETNFGYSKYLLHKRLVLINQYKKFPKIFKKMVSNLPIKHDELGKLNDASTNIINLFKTYTLFSNKQNILSDDFAEVLKNYTHPFDSLIPPEIIERDSQMVFPLIDINSWMVDDLLLKIDKMSMAHSLEARVPFLDYQLVEFALSIPSKYKINGNVTKALLRKVSRKVVPESILNRKQHGFNVPIDVWLKDELREYTLDILSDSALKRRGYFNINSVHCMLGEFFSGKKDWSVQIWGLLTFELWCRKFIDK